jgi:hypothetical protein
MARVSSSPSFSQIFKKCWGWGGARCSAGHLAGHRWLGFKEKGFASRKEKEGKEIHT